MAKFDDYISHDREIILAAEALVELQDEHGDARRCALAMGRLCKAVTSRIPQPDEEQPVPVVAERVASSEGIRDHNARCANWVREHGQLVQDALVNDAGECRRAAHVDCSGRYEGCLRALGALRTLILGR